MSVTDLSEYRKRLRPRVAPGDLAFIEDGPAPPVTMGGLKTPHPGPLPEGRGCGAAANDAFDRGADLPDGVAFRLTIEIGSDGAVAVEDAVRPEDGPFSPATLAIAARTLAREQARIAGLAAAQSLRARIVAVLTMVCERHGLTLAQVAGRCRYRVFIDARAEAAAALRAIPGPDGRPALSLPRIGRILGGRDHSTIACLIRRAERQGGRG